MAEDARRLAQENALLRATLEATADGLLVVDSQGKWVSFNRRFVAMWRIPAAVVEARDDEQGVAYVLDQLLDPQGFLSKVRELYDHPEQESRDVLLFKDGRVFERLSGPQRVDGEYVGRVWSFRDVTERCRIEEERDRLLIEEKQERAAAEQAVRARDEFLSVASHELRTPLTSLQLAVQSLLRLARSHSLRDAPPVPLLDVLATAERQTRRLSRFIESLLDVSRIQAGRLEFHPEPVDLSQVAREVAGHFREELLAAGCAVTLALEEGVVGRWDRTRLEQVVTNLLANAIKYGARRPIRLTLSRLGPVARLSVEDQGIGVAHEHQELIFDRFERAVSTRNYGGLGLGLYIVQKIVQAHGGLVRVKSSPGQGATFTVELPID